MDRRLPRHSHPVPLRDQSLTWTSDILAIFDVQLALFFLFLPLSHEAIQLDIFPFFNLEDWSRGRSQNQGLPLWVININ
ncbi:hypothetical protein BDW66DRAFT_141068 [Aspergillus desertorum]